MTGSPLNSVPACWDLGMVGSTLGQIPDTGIDAPWETRAVDSKPYQARPKA